MKSITTSIIMCLLISIVIIGAGIVNPVFGIEKHKQVSNEKKWALIVAISNYPDSTGWNKINAENDVPLITNMLLRQGFQEDNILVLEESNATKQGILDAFRTHLIENVEQGDIIYIHFSSHGQQIFDDNGDEIDGFDESVVPYDANMHYVPGHYEGQLHIRDDELGELLTQLRKQAGPQGNVLTVLDACHSGTATRGLATARGTKEVLAPEDYNPDVSNSRGNELYMGTDVEQVADNLAPTVTISGASANQLNYETRDADNRKVGSLSYALSLAFQDAEQITTYRELFDRIKIEMNRLAPRQAPQIEGIVDQQIFGGDVITQEPYFVPVKWTEKNQLVLNAGVIHGFTQNSTVDIYSFETRNFSSTEPLAKGVITTASTLESTVEITGDAAALRQKKIKIVLDEQSYENLTVRLQNRLTEPKEQVSELIDSLDNNRFVEIVKDDPDLVLIAADSTNRSASLSLVTAQEQMLYQTDWNLPVNRIASSVEHELNLYAKTQFLRNMSLSSDELKVELEIVPIEYRRVNGRPVITDTLDISDFTTETGQIELPVDQAFFLRVIHDGSQDAYYTIINFTNSGRAQITVPFGKYKPGDFIIETFQQKSLTRLLLVTTKPEGTEAFKLIATKEPLDLRPILPLTRSGGSAGTVSNPFQKLLKSAASTTRSDRLGVPPAVANTYTITFRVISN